jgi:hypothetical protein
MIKRIKRECLHCSQEFIPKTVTSFYCREQCIKNAYQKRKRQEKLELKRQELIDQIPLDKILLTVPEAVLLFDIAKRTLYRLIKQNVIPSINEGTRLIKVNREVLQEMFPPASKEKIEKKILILTCMIFLKRIAILLVRFPKNFSYTIRVYTSISESTQFPPVKLVIMFMLQKARLTNYIMVL